MDIYSHIPPYIYLYIFVKHPLASFYCCHFNLRTARLFMKTPRGRGKGCPGGGGRTGARQLNSHRAHSKSIELIITTKLRTESFSIGIHRRSVQSSHFSRFAIHPHKPTHRLVTVPYVEMVFWGGRHKSERVRSECVC